MVDYLITWGDPYERLLDVQVRFIAPCDAPRLILPSWRPGRYLIQNFAANLRSWSSNLRKEGKAAWRCDARAGEEVLVTYRYYAGVLDAGSTFVDEDEVYVNPSNLLMMVEGLREQPSLLTIAAPVEWVVETQLATRHREAHDGGSFADIATQDVNTLLARDYDYLIDSPVLMAERLTRHSFVEGGARVQLILRHDEGIDGQAFVEPLRAITRAQAALFGGLPFQEYRFLAHVGDRWHGVEHEDSCALILKRSALLGARPGDEGFDHALSLCSHELFHAWNVKRMLPAVFKPYDYTRETPTRLLWVMEGVTSYYGEQSLLRAGLWSQERYLEHLQKEIETLEGSPARLHLSLAQASFDAWLQEPSQTHDKQNAWISFYNKGEIVAALLDISLRARTQVTLDDVMRYLWREYGEGGRGMEEDAFEQAVAAVSGADFSDFFARYVDGVEPLPYAETFGLADVAFDTAVRDRLALGAKLRAESSSLVIEAVLRGGAAMAAGLLPHDELIAIDGGRTTSEADVRRVLASMREGEGVEVLAGRAGVVQRRTLVPRRDPRPAVTLVAVGASALRDAWLRRLDE
jgi:predicted metalloprotease with PDZ domain